MNENIHQDHDHSEEIRPIVSDDTNVPDVKTAESGEIDVEALKREWAAEWDQILQADKFTLNDYSPTNVTEKELQKSLHQYLNYKVAAIRRDMPNSEHIGEQLQKLLVYRSDLSRSLLSSALRQPWFAPQHPLLKNKQERQFVEEMMTFAYDYLKKYTDYILSVPKPALGSDAELLRPAAGAGEVDEAGLVRPVYPENKSSDDAKT